MTQFLKTLFFPAVHAGANETFCNNEQSSLLASTTTTGATTTTTNNNNRRRSSVIPTSTHLLPAVAEDEDNDATTGRTRTAAAVPQARALPPPQWTVFELLTNPSSPEEREYGLTFLRRTWAILVVQYGTILFLACPFVYVDALRNFVLQDSSATSTTTNNTHGSYLLWSFKAVSTLGMMASVTLAFTKGTQYPYAQIALVGVTIFVGVNFGLLFCQYVDSWGLYGFMAVGQATTNFGIVLILFQWDWPDHIRLTHITILCAAVSGMWIVVVGEQGDTEWTTAFLLGLAGWFYVVYVLLCCRWVIRYVGSEEYMLAALFMLAPAALVRLGSRQRQLVTTGK